MSFTSFIANFFTKAPPKAPLLLHNTLSGEMEPFTPLQTGTVRMYNCGPTVYDYQHIGNLRPYIFADVLRRTLRLWGYTIEQVINITDVGHLVDDGDQGEDKIEKGAKAQGESVEELVERITAAYFADLDQVGVDRRPISFPRATEYIGEQIALVQALEEKGYAYTILDGVYFDTKRFKEYGKLGHIDLAQLRSGARVAEAEGKRNPTDFALWKFSPKEGTGEKRLQEWPSPWGVGFPGWHIECTAMIFKLLGRQIDIHTGGIDHIPVHHNNEIAQAEGATGKQYARYWLHNAFITIEGKKISKSLGNTIYLRNIIERGFSPLAYRYLLLTAHYRSPVNFTWTALEAAQTALTRLHRHYFEDLASSRGLGGGTPSEAFVASFTEAIGRDLDTPKAIACMWEMLKDESLSASQKHDNLLYADQILGFGLRDGNKRLAQMTSLAVMPAADVPSNIQALIDARQEARGAKDFAKADCIRDELYEKGYEIEDGANGPSVKKL